MPNRVKLLMRNEMGGAWVWLGIRGVIPRAAGEEPAGRLLDVIAKLRWNEMRASLMNELVTSVVSFNTALVLV